MCVHVQPEYAFTFNQNRCSRCAGIRNCYAGLDLSSTGDISSVCYAFPCEKEILLLSRHYLPEAQLENIANKNRGLYRLWGSQGWLRTTQGDCIDYDVIRDDILKDSERFNIRLIGFDTWNATHLRTQLQGAGLDVEPFPQTYIRFSPVAKSAEVFVNRQIIRHNGDPILAWAMGNVVMESDAIVKRLNFEYIINMSYSLGPVIKCRDKRV